MEDGADRRIRGTEFWETASTTAVESPRTPFREAFIDFVAAEVWARPGLARRDRRWITLACVAASAQPVPIRSHLRAALASGDMTIAELREFALHVAVYAGWPRASFVDSTIDELEEEFGGAR